MTLLFKRYLPGHLLIIFLLCLTAVSDAKLTQGRICHQQDCLDIEVAYDNLDLLKGLQERTSLGEKEGMLFIFQKSGLHKFWMKDTLIPLDIIWINQSFQIVYIAAKVKPCQTKRCPVYTPPVEAQYVLELNAGTGDHLGFKIGDPLELHLE